MNMRTPKLLEAQALLLSPRFLNHCHVGLQILCGGGCPVHHDMLSSISGQYPPDASSTRPSVVTTTIVSKHCYMSPENKTALG